MPFGIRTINRAAFASYKSFASKGFRYLRVVRFQSKMGVVQSLIFLHGLRMLILEFLKNRKKVLKLAGEL